MFLSPFFFFKTHFRKLTGRTWQLRRCLLHSSRWFGTSWTSATLQTSSRRWTPPTPPQRCLRTVTASSRWGGKEELLYNQTGFGCDSLSGGLQTEIFPLCSPCRSLHRTTSIFASLLCGCLSGLWLQAEWNVDMDEKSLYTFSTFCLRLYSTYSTAIEVIKWSFECPQKVAVSQHESVCVHWYSNWLKGLLLE